MDKPHKQVVTTYPIALKFGQTRLHVASPIPWHARSEAIQCPDCKTVFIVTDGYPKLEFFNELKKQHDKHEAHPDYIASAPQWTRIEECSNCGM
jgi:hypothetical protein